MTVAALCWFVLINELKIHMNNEYNLDRKEHSVNVVQSTLKFGKSCTATNAATRKKNDFVLFHSAVTIWKGITDC